MEFIEVSKRPHRVLWGLLLCCIVQSALGFGVESGGETSVNKANNDAFSLPAGNLSFRQQLDFKSGNSFFRNPWVIAPSTTTSRDGLGPLFNTNGCQNCHIRDGRGHLPTSPEGNAVSMLVRLSENPQNDSDWERVKNHGVIPHPAYGDQIQDFGIPGVEPEARIVIEWEYSNVTFADGSLVTLRKPILKLENLAYGEFSDHTVFSIRLATQMIGLGLLEALTDEQIQANADPEDKNSDGISGRWNTVWDVKQQKMVMGRFGWKAAQPSLRQQNAAAFNGDLGITSTLFPHENCTSAQQACLDAPSGGEFETSDKLLDRVTFYTANIGVPIRRNAEDSVVKSGEKVFVEAGCDGCHTVTFTTPKVKGAPQLSEQTIHPYTDMLLHDMGEGLADNRPVYSASGSEWRTAPLWGIGLTLEVSGHENYLHDGRAESLLEAVLWHGGEAQASRDYIVKSSTADREALLAFLRSL